MKKSPITVQQWVDTLPQSQMTPVASGPTTSTPSKQRPHLTLLGREPSAQSDDNSSYCSSVESVLESRRPDPEAVLLGLGFGPPNPSNNIPRIPQRFLKPSQVLRNIDFQKFMERQCEYQSYEFKYRTVPPSPAHQSPKSC